MSYASVKDYESGKTVPTPETVGLMAEVYGTPELKWLHCSESCPIGREIAHTDGDIGEDDIRGTYFDLAGTFDLADEIEARLHKVIGDGPLDESELPVMEDVLAKLDRISESAKELRVWVERQRGGKRRELSALGRSRSRKKASDAFFRRRTHRFYPSGWGDAYGRLSYGFYLRFLL